MYTQTKNYTEKRWIIQKRPHPQLDPNQLKKLSRGLLLYIQLRPPP